MCFRRQPLYLKRMILRFAEILITGLFLSCGFHKNFILAFIQRRYISWTMVTLVMLKISTYSVKFEFEFAVISSSIFAFKLSPMLKLM